MKTSSIRESADRDEYLLEVLFEDKIQIKEWTFCAQACALLHAVSKEHEHFAA
jgi:Mn-dependent DtxR family transcriptional regulator